MPPTLALLAGYALAFWAFRWESRHRPYPSAALWLPTFWMMRCGSRSLDSWFGGGEFGRLDPILIMGLIVIGGIVLARRPCNWGQIWSHNWAVLVFFCYLALSLTWAEALDNPLVKLTRPLCDLIMALIVVTEINPLQAITTLYRRTAFLLIPMSIILIKYYPYLGRGHDKSWGSDPWIGVATHKNPLGQLCMVAVFGFLWLLLVVERRKWTSLLRPSLPTFYLAMSAYLLLFGGPQSRSSTSMLCIGTAVGLFLGFGYMRNRVNAVIRWILVGSASIAALALLLEFAGTSLQAVVAEMYGKDPTLSDRTYLWRDVIRLGMENPVLGAGYGGFWIPSLYDQLSPEVNNWPAQSHSGYLETFANLGLLGCALLAMIIISTLSSATKLIQTDFEYGRLRLVLLFTVLLMNYSEASFPRAAHLWWFGFLMIALYARPWVNWPMPAPVAVPASTPEAEAKPVDELSGLPPRRTA